MPDDSPGKDLEPFRPRHMRRLSWWQRVVSGTAGAGMLTFSGWMQYRPGDDGVAAAAMVASGAVAGLLGLVGVVPSRIKSGEHEIELWEDAFDQTVSAATEHMNPEAIQDFTADLEDANISNPNPVLERAQSQIRQAEISERYVLDMLNHACQTLGLELFRSASEDNPFDGYVTDGSKRLYVLVKQRLTRAVLVRSIKPAMMVLGNHILVTAMNLSTLEPFEPYQRGDLESDIGAHVTVVLPRLQAMMHLLATAFDRGAESVPTIAGNFITLSLPLRGGDHWKPPLQDVP